MAFPKLLQKLFQDSGAGSMLRTDIIPIDSALSDTSTNGVQNKIVKAAIQAVADVCHQVGDLRLYAGTDVPDGWFRCDGSTVANMQTNYPKLYAVLGTNVLPNYSGRVPLGATADINTTVDAGLPNIIGQAGTQLSNFNTGNNNRFAEACSGAFTGVQTANTGGHSSGTQNSWSYFKFDASKSNSLYGKSVTVMPPAVKCSFLIKHD